MSPHKSPLSLRELLDICSSPESPDWEAGWSEFIKRYKVFIKGKVAKRCSEFNVPRLRMQFPETVKDVVSKVFLKLCTNQCRALQNFRERDNELAFRCWLSLICSRTASRYIEEYFVDNLVDEKIEKLREYVAGLDYDHRWELYEAVVERLRTSFKQRKRHLERDIHILLLYVWADFPAIEIAIHPCLHELGPRVVDNIVSRLRKELRRHRNF